MAARCRPRPRADEREGRTGARGRPRRARIAGETTAAREPKNIAPAASAPAAARTFATRCSDARSARRPAGPPPPWWLRQLFRGGASRRRVGGAAGGLGGDESPTRRAPWGVPGRDAIAEGRRRRGLHTLPLCNFVVVATSDEILLDFRDSPRITSGSSSSRPGAVLPPHFPRRAATGRQRARHGSSNRSRAGVLGLRGTEPARDPARSPRTPVPRPRRVGTGPPRPSIPTSRPPPREPKCSSRRPPRRSRSRRRCARRRVPRPPRAHHGPGPPPRRPSRHSLRFPPFGPHQPRHRRVALARRFRTRRVSRPTTSRRSLPKMLARRLRRHRNPERHRRRRRIVSNRVRRQVTSRRKQLQRTHSRVGRGARRETRPPRRGFRGPMGGGGVKEVRATRTTWTAASSSSIRRIILGRATVRTLATGDLRAPSNARHGAGGVPTV